VISRPRDRAAACISRISANAIGNFELISMASVPALGTSLRQLYHAAGRSP
jgi:hypothetical protein